MKLDDLKDILEHRLADSIPLLGLGPRKANPRKHERQVLFIVHLEGDDLAVAGEMHEWLTDTTARPDWVCEVKLCGCYVAGAGVDVHLTMPMSLYASVLESNAITFVRYTKSANVLLSRNGVSGDVPQPAV